MTVGWVSGAVDWMRGADHGWLADLLPGLLLLARRMGRGYPPDLVDDLVMSGCESALAARSAWPAAPQSYLFGAARRGVVMEARRMLWRGRVPGGRPHVPLSGESAPFAEGLPADLWAELSLAHDRTGAREWGAAVATWAAGRTLADVGAELGVAQSTVHAWRGRACLPV